jgi:erythronate-4-phosphate dehydrogenase
MANADFFAAMRTGAIFINTSRGAVMVEKHLLANRAKLAGIVLDVWENEPGINFETVAAADSATPHIAGYSYDGKARGTGMLADSLSAFFFKPKSWSAHTVLDAEPLTPIDCTSAARPLLQAVSVACPLVRDDTALRAIGKLPNAARGRGFDDLRKNYPKRLEFPHYIVRCTDPGTCRMLAGLGFVVDPVD